MVFAYITSLLATHFLPVLFFVYFIKHSIRPAVSQPVLSQFNAQLYLTVKQTKNYFFIFSSKSRRKVESAKNSSESLTIVWSKVYRLVDHAPRFNCVYVIDNVCMYRDGVFEPKFYLKFYLMTLDAVRYSGRGYMNPTTLFIKLQWFPPSELDLSLQVFTVELTFVPTPYL